MSGGWEGQARLWRVHIRSRKVFNSHLVCVQGPLWPVPCMSRRWVDS
jgi:hypothetical protein